MNFKVIRNFAFFNKQISEKYGKKCCRYNQNGKPLPQDKVERLQSTVKDFINGWKVEENHTRLIRHYYVEDYLMAVQFIKEIAKIDALSAKNTPSFSIDKGQLLTVKLFSPPLDGLSQLDFELAMSINRTLKPEEYFLIPIEDINNYEKQVKAYRLKKQSEQIQAQLKADFDKLQNNESKTENAQI